ncbi:MAG: phenylalanine--tRNA ligase subunit alpha [Dehalococcoidia bacterium]
MNTEPDSVSEIESAALRDLGAAADAASLEDWRVSYLGRKGRLTLLLRSLPQLAMEERKVLGASGNALKQRLEDGYEQRREALERRRIDEVISDRIDVTLPGYPLPRGRLHPITQTTRDMLAVFAGMGFQTVEGPEVEWDHYNFEALRIPADHPARDMWDTLWIDYEVDGKRPMLLRTHTSPNQVRFMETHEPPIRIVVPGKCYRFEATDATHEWMLTQIEGLAVDKGISLTDLKGTLAEFARRLFGQDRRVTFRCSYFPFVEPGMEISIDCFICRGEGCRTCHYGGWIEILGAGMVHPEILANMGYDPGIYTGFAFGVGVERIALLRYGVDDIRHFYSNDLRFLRQF